MLTTTLYHTLQALNLNQPHELIAYGTHTLIIILKLRPNLDHVPPPPPGLQKQLLHHPRLSLTRKFLGNAENKMQLFRYLSKAILKAEPLRYVRVYSTYDDTVLIKSSDQQLAYAT